MLQSRDFEFNHVIVVILIGLVESSGAPSKVYDATMRRESIELKS